MDRPLTLVLLTGLLHEGTVGCDLLGGEKNEPLGRLVFTQWDSTDRCAFTTCPG